MVTCYRQEKVLSSQNVLLWIFLEIRYLIWSYAELNRLLVGFSLIPLNIKLKQDDRTVYCNHNSVAGDASVRTKWVWCLSVLFKGQKKQQKKPDNSLNLGQIFFLDQDIIILKIWRKKVLNYTSVFSFLNQVSNIYLVPSIGNIFKLWTKR